jgi:hypothetical protein
MEKAAEPSRHITSRNYDLELVNWTDMWGGFVLRYLAKFFIKSRHT